MAQSASSRGEARLTYVTTRLDRLPFARFHLLVAAALGVVWLLDSFEVNIINSVIPTIQNIFKLSDFQASLTITIWLLGIMFGAFFFGYLADRFGRRRLFILTLTLYATCTIISALAVNFGMFIVFRFLTAIGVGAEYSAVNTAISEFIPKNQRGATNAAVMSFWNIGALLSSVVSIVFITILPNTVGWRVAFAFGAIAAVMIVWVRRSVPESPRWLAIRGRADEAETIVSDIEERVAREKGTMVDQLPTAMPAPLAEHAPQSFFSQVGELIRRYPGRLALGCTLDLSEAFGYYGLFAVVDLVVLKAVHIPSGQVPIFNFGGSIGALLGGFIVIGALDHLGRKISVPVFYTLAAVSAIAMGPATASGSATAVIIAFFAANFCATSAWISAYPTFTEIFPTHLRGTGVGLSVAVGRIGAAFGTSLLVFVASNTPAGPAGGFVLLALLWLVGAFAMVPWYYRGVEGKGRSLEQMTVFPTSVQAPVTTDR
jgi:MFS family permease